MTPAVVTLYRRPACGLCDEAERLLGPLMAGLGASLRTVDISASADLLDRFGLAIPVVEVDGVEVARAPLRRSALEGALGEALSGRGDAPR